MPTPRTTKDEPPPVSDAPASHWFTEMVKARKTHDHKRTNEAQRHLRRLGWSVLPIRPSEKAAK